jgi:hypothetical protein
MTSVSESISERAPMMMPHPTAAISADVSDTATYRAKPRGPKSTSLMAAVLLIAPLSFSIGLLAHHLRSSADQPTEFPASCARGEDEAIEKLISLIRGRSDTSFRQTADAIFLIRRARRNCQAGFISLAEGDYHTLSQIRAKP